MLLPPLADMGVSENKGYLNFGGPYNKDYYLGYYFRVPYFRKPPHASSMQSILRHYITSGVGSGKCGGMWRASAVEIRHPRKRETKSLNT